ncbi:MAG: DUF2934 domain-containing protein [candidate division Zixibacteria bacterium]|nr:DUF2934 domain-containing protein [candidate division Zixibacteria bacterium]
MNKEIKRNTWAKFCKKFSSDNRYRDVKIKVRDKRKNDINTLEPFPFMGLTLAKKGRLIDGLEFFAGWGDAERVLSPVAAIKEPLKVIVKLDQQGRDEQLQVVAKDGTELYIELYGEPDRNRQHSLVEKVAYSMYEKRGYTPGDDRADWLEAERKVREAELQFV